MSLLIPLALVPSTSGQSEAPPQAGSDLVMIEVVATDRGGDPVRGLTVDDFRAEIDGQPASIVSVMPAPTVATAPDGRSPASRRGLSLLLYVDSTNVDVKRRREVLERLGKSLQDLRSMDRVMVVTASGGSLAVEQEFTSSPLLLEDALQRIAQSTVPQQRDSEYDEILRLIERTLGPAQNRFDPQSETDSQNVAKSLRAYSDQQHQRTVATCQQLRAAVDSLETLPGRRVVVYVGAGMSINPGEELLSALRSSRTAYREEGALEGTESSLPVDLAQDTGQVVSDLARYASIRNVTMHSFNVGNQRSPMSTGAAETGATDLGSTQPGENITLPAINFGQRTDLEDSLRLVAAETGGVVVRRHQNVVRTMDRLLHNREGTYTLAFEPPDTDSGEAHVVDIAAMRKRLRVRHRRTFSVPNEDDLIVELMRTALLGGATENPLDAWVESKNPGPLEGDSYAVNVRIRVPVENLALEPLQQSHRAQLTVFSASSDGDLWTSRIDKRVLPILVPNDDVMAAMGQSIDYLLEMRVFRGRDQIALAVRDDLGPEVSILTLVAPGPEASQPPGR